MDVMYRRCAGIDIGKRSVKVCVWSAREGGAGPTSRVTSWGSMTRQVLALREHLIEAGVECVVMEATGNYWKPFYYVLEGAEFELMLVNAHQVKNMPGRKSDVSDAAWLAQLGAHGLVRASLVPPPPVRELRDLTRTRTAVTRDRTREAQRLEGLLEDAGIKLSSVVSNTLGVSARRMLRAMAAGQRDPEALAALADYRLQAPASVLVEALKGRFTEHHAFLVTVHLDLIEQLEDTIEQITARIEKLIEPFRPLRELICTIPGISTTVAEVVIAETGGDMTAFPTAQHLASWAGTAPGSNESAGVVKSTKTRKGNRHLKGALGIAAMSAAQQKDTFFSAKYSRIAKRRGPNRAIVAIERAMLIAIWHMATTGTVYTDPGADYYQRLNPEKTKRRAVHQLERLGYQVTLQPTG